MSNTDNATAMSWALTTQADNLRRAIARAHSDLTEALTALDRGNRPGGGMSGRVLSQSALDVDSSSSRLHALLDVAGMVLTEEQMVAAITARN